MEQRSHPRFNVSARCQVTCNGFRLEGTTNNLSRTGVLMRLHAGNPKSGLPAIGDVMTVDIELPANRRYGQKYLRCKGAVVRVVSASKSVPRVALRVFQMEFKSGTQQRAAATAVGTEIEQLFLER